MNIQGKIKLSKATAVDKAYEFDMHYTQSGEDLYDSPFHKQ